MRIKTRNILAGLAVACLATSASAGSSYLDALVSGGTLTSDNGKLTFSNFSFINTIGSTSASSINVLSTDSGLRFAPSLIADSNQRFDFIITYDVSTSDDYLITSASMNSIAATQGGSVAAAQTLSGGTSQNLLNLFTNSTTLNSDSDSFGGTSFISVANNIGVNGPAFLSDIEQTYNITPGDTTSTAVPTPTAALAGLALLGLVGVRRRRAA